MIKTNTLWQNYMVKVRQQRELWDWHGNMIS